MTTRSQTETLSAAPAPTEAAGNAPLPPEVRAFIQSQDPELKDDPNHFVGRIGELDRLQRIVQRTMKAGKCKKPKRAPAGQIIFAAPGAGKTSLMTELTKRLQKLRMSVIEVKPNDITTPERFSAAIRRHKPWSRRKKLMDFAEGLARGLASGTDDVAKAAINTAFKTHGVPLEVDDLEVLQTAVNHWLANETPDTESVLKLLQHGRKGGCVLIIDEAQDMREHLNNGDYKAHMHLIIEYLGIPKSRRRLGIGQATVILAGLSDTPTVVEGVGSQGLKPKVLPPLPPADVREVINLAINDGAGKNADLATKAQRMWTEPIAQRYGDWTRHTQAGAQAIELLLEKYGEQMLTAPWRWTAIMTLGDLYRNEVYDSILRRTRAAGHTKGVSNELIDAVTLTLVYNGNRVEQRQLHRVISGTIKALTPEDADGTDSGVRALTSDTIQRMLRSGLLDRTDELPEAADRHPAAYYCPIPSLLDHTTLDQSPWHTDIMAILDEHKLHHTSPTSPDQRFRPLWGEWDDDEQTAEDPTDSPQ